MNPDRNSNIAGDAVQPDQLQHYADQLRLYSRRSLHARHREQQYIAVKLEEDILQLIALIEMSLGSLCRTSNNATSLRTVDEIQKYLDKAARSIKEIVDTVKPPLLRELGLPAALIRLAAQTESRHHIRIDVVIRNEIPPLDPEKSLRVYRAVQECFMNIIKHARADSAKLDITAKHRQALLRIVVEDNGVGFSVSEKFPQAPDIRRLGLFGIREQIAPFEGSLEIDSSPGQGTRICLNIPIEKKKMV